MTEREKVELVEALEGLLTRVKADEIIGYLMTWDDGERAKIVLGGTGVPAMALALLKVTLDKVDAMTYDTWAREKAREIADSTVFTWSSIDIVTVSAERTALASDIEKALLAARLAGWREARANPSMPYPGERRHE